LWDKGFERKGINLFFKMLKVTREIVKRFWNNPKKYGSLVSIKVYKIFTPKKSYIRMTNLLIWGVLVSKKI
jgi:hypothetical protein